MDNKEGIYGVFTEDVIKCVDPRCACLRPFFRALTRAQCSRCSKVNEAVLLGLPPDKIRVCVSKSGRPVIALTPVPQRLAEEVVSARDMCVALLQ